MKQGIVMGFWIGLGLILAFFMLNIVFGLIGRGVKGAKA